MFSSKTKEGQEECKWWWVFFLNISSSKNEPTTIPPKGRSWPIIPKILQGWLHSNQTSWNGTREGILRNKMTKDVVDIGELIHIGINYFPTFPSSTNIAQFSFFVRKKNNIILCVKCPLLEFLSYFHQLLHGWFKIKFCISETFFNLMMCLWASDGARITKLCHLGFRLRLLKGCSEPFLM